MKNMNSSQPTASNACTRDLASAAVLTAAPKTLGPYSP